MYTKGELWLQPQTLKSSLLSFVTAVKNLFEMRHSLSQTATADIFERKLVVLGKHFWPKGRRADCTTETMSCQRRQGPQR